MSPSRPATFTALPVGVSFFGAAWSEPTLIRIAWAFEQAAPHRRPPRFRVQAEPALRGRRRSRPPSAAAGQKTRAPRTTQQRGRAMRASRGSTSAARRRKPPAPRRRRNGLPSRADSSRRAGGSGVPPSAGRAKDLLGEDAAADRDLHRIPAALPKLSSRAAPRRRRRPAASTASRCRATGSRVSTFSGWPSQSIQDQNFSMIQVACPAGESTRPYPRVCGWSTVAWSSRSPSPGSAGARRGRPSRCPSGRPIVLRSTPEVGMFRWMPWQCSWSWIAIAVLTAAPPVAALGEVPLVAEPGHEFGPGVGDLLDAPARRGRFVPRSRTPAERARQVEGVLLRAAWAVGSSSGSNTSRNSTIEPGQPWVMTSGAAPRCFERRWREVDAQPVDLGPELVEVVQAVLQGGASRRRRPSTRRLPSCRRAGSPGSSRRTVLALGPAVAASRRRRSVSSSSSISMR